MLSVHKQVNVRTMQPFQPGIGPHSEAKTVELVLRELAFFVPMILMASGAPLMGQEPAAGLDVGSRVRLTFPCELASPSFPESAGRTCRSDGRLALLTGDTIMIAAGDSTLVYDLNAVSRVEVSRGRKSHWLAGAGIGFVVGAATAYVALSSGGSTSTCDQSANQDAVSTGECIALAALVGGVPGAGLGAVAGLFIRSERWQDAPVDRLRVSVGPGPGSWFQLAISITH